MAAGSIDGCVLRPEGVILLACARRELSPEDVGRIARAEGVNWDGLADAARTHGIGYFLALHLKGLSVNRTDGRGGPVRLPEAFARRLREETRQAAVRALVLLECQLRLAAEFQSQQVPVVWLKGLALSEQLYGRFEARQANDLDVLVGPGQMAGAEDCLGRLGFERFRNPVPEEEDHPAGSHHRIWSGRLIQDGQVSVELHYRLAGPPRCQPPVTELLGRSRIVPLMGQPIRVPSLEDELLILCLHAHQHNFGFLRCLMDVAEYVKRYREQLDWQEFLARASRYRCRGRVTAALALAQQCLGLELAAAAQPKLTSAQRWALQGLSPAALLDTATERNPWLRARLAVLMDRWSDVVQMARPYFMPSTRHLRASCREPWARFPGLPRLMYAARLAGKLLRGRSS